MRLTIRNEEGIAMVAVEPVGGLLRVILSPEEDESYSFVIADDTSVTVTDVGDNAGGGER